ncbi:MAG: tripartite tricarboxylate transporter TctB family protein [Polaromonas sp.]|uniref:tripartite tricarboxylate transporter TctB family protein n=1 Tax=Polaromonas sp. TaxID=1869339 RepID=UPI002734909C|nr:tripartite tricarboxylate transporter TctB family protein [Polaromonas sp.]MDP2817998.1 tripartite tricarboxylate transporter TctB family protein [Polaromonas sp.]
MEPNQESGAKHRTGVATNVIEAIVALCVLVMGVVVVVNSWALGAGWTTDGPGAGYFPFYIGIVLSISGAGIIYQALLGKNRNTEIFVDSEQLKRVLSVFLPALVYVLAVQFVGLYVASAIYIALFMIILGKFSPIKSVIAALIVNTLFFFMFEVWFRVPLFKGNLDPLSFLGY